MGEVPSLVARTFVTFASRRGYPSAQLLAGLPAEFGRSGRRVDWDDLVSFLARLEERDPNAIAAFADYYVHEVPLISLLGSQVVSVSGIYRLALFAWRRVWPMLSIETGVAAHGLTISFTVREPYRPSPQFARLAEEVLTRLPRVVGKEDATLETTLKTTRSMAWRVAIGATKPSADDPAPEDVFRSLQTDLFGGMAIAVPTEWRLSPGERDVVLALADGRSVNEIAEASGSSRETVRTLIKRAMNKASVHRQGELVAKLHASRREG